MADGWLHMSTGFVVTQQELVGGTLLASYLTLLGESVWQATFTVLQMFGGWRDLICLTVAVKASAWTVFGD